MSRFSLRGRPRKLKKSALCAKGAAAAARRLGVRVVEHEALADQIRVVVEHGAVQIQQALLVDVNLRAVRPLEHLVAETRLLLPREGVAQPRAAPALDSDTQSTVVDALLGHQRTDPACGNLGNLNSHQSLAISHQPSAIFMPSPAAARLSRQPTASSCSRRWLP